MTTTEIIKAIETKTGMTIDGDPDKIVLALRFLTDDKFNKQVTEEVWANRKG